MYGASASHRDRALLMLAISSRRTGFHEEVAFMVGAMRQVAFG